MNNPVDQLFETLRQIQKQARAEKDIRKLNELEYTTTICTDAQLRSLAEGINKRIIQPMVERGRLGSGTNQPVGFLSYWKRQNGSE